MLDDAQYAQLVTDYDKVLTELCRQAVELYLAGERAMSRRLTDKAFALAHDFYLNQRLRSTP